MKKIQIIGMGNVGSAIAYTLLLSRRFNRIHVVDINKKKVLGEYLDLNRVIHINKIPTILTWSTKPIDFFDVYIICAGIKGDYNKYEFREMQKIMFEKNIDTCRDILSGIKSGKVIIVTNPAKELADKLKQEYKNLDITHAGDVVDEIIDGVIIARNKGHTCWGIAVEVTEMIK